MTGVVNPTRKGKHLIILHIGSKKGFVKMDYFALNKKKKFYGFPR